mgnify:CR=1 FL=1
MAWCALLPWSFHPQLHRRHPWSSWTSATCRCSYSDEVPFHQHSSWYGCFRQIVNLCFAAGMPACLPSTGSRWGWAARRGNGSQRERSQTSCQVASNAPSTSLAHQTLIPVDAQRLVDSVPFSFFVIIGPIELILCLLLLYRLLGIAVLVHSLTENIW